MEIINAWSANTDTMYNRRRILGDMEKSAMEEIAKRIKQAILEGRMKITFSFCDDMVGAPDKLMSKSLYKRLRKKLEGKGYFTKFKKNLGYSGGGYGIEVSWGV